jgi:hypothetical protein
MSYHPTRVPLPESQVRAKHGWPAGASTRDPASADGGDAGTVFPAVQRLEAQRKTGRDGQGERPSLARLAWYISSTLPSQCRPGPIFQRNRMILDDPFAPFPRDLSLELPPRLCCPGPSGPHTIDKRAPQSTTRRPSALSPRTRGSSVRASCLSRGGWPDPWRRPGIPPVIRLSLLLAPPRRHRAADKGQGSPANWTLAGSNWSQLGAPSPWSGIASVSFPNRALDRRARTRKTESS